MVAALAIAGMRRSVLFKVWRWHVFFLFISSLHRWWLLCNTLFIGIELLLFKTTSTSRAAQVWNKSCVSGYILRKIFHMILLHQSRSGSNSKIWQDSWIIYTLGMFRRIWFGRSNIECFYLLLETWWVLLHYSPSSSPTKPFTIPFYPLNQLCIISSLPSWLHNLALYSKMFANQHLSSLQDQNLNNILIFKYFVYF